MASTDTLPPAVHIGPGDEPVPATDAQRTALFNVWKRVLESERVTWAAFAKRAQPTVGCDGALVVPFAGMWLAIEADGYTHS